LTAAKLVGEVAGASRFSSDAKLARAAGVAPIPVSSGKTNRHRLDRGGNRQINATIHRIAVTRLRCHPETQDYIARKRSEGKSTKEAIPCFKRHLARRIWHLLQAPRPTEEHCHHDQLGRPRCRTGRRPCQPAATPPRERGDVIGGERLAAEAPLAAGDLLDQARRNLAHVLPSIATIASVRRSTISCF
jgi:transposase IS116/IS110/IS902 family protein